MGKAHSRVTHKFMSFVRSHLRIRGVDHRPREVSFRRAFWKQRLKQRGETMPNVGEDVEREEGHTSGIWNTSEDT
jgi:hypothetical protein